MTEQSTQEPRTIGDPDRFVILDGEIQWYDTLTLCLERADGIIDLTLFHARESEFNQPGLRPNTLCAGLHATQQELDDIRHVLHQWYEAGMPKERESDAAALGEGKAPTPLSDDSVTMEPKRAIDAIRIPISDWHKAEELFWGINGVVELIHFYGNMEEAGHHEYSVDTDAIWKSSFLLKKQIKEIEDLFYPPNGLDEENIERREVQS